MDKKFNFFQQSVHKVTELFNTWPYEEIAMDFVDSFINSYEATVSNFEVG